MVIANRKNYLILSLEMQNGLTAKQNMILCSLVQCPVSCHRTCLGDGNCTSEAEVGLRQDSLFLKLLIE